MHLNYRVQCGKHSKQISVFKTILQITRVSICILNCTDICRFPFDWQNPFGFAMAIAIQYAMISYGLTIGGCVLVLAISAFFYGIAVSKCIKISLFTIQRSAQTKIDQSILLQQMIELFEMHSSAKQLSTNRNQA